MAEDEELLKEITNDDIIFFISDNNPCNSH
jgi:hypothetical protein